MISAILLAAGQSKRMEGENKLIKKIQGIPLISRCVKNILTSTIDELIIVLGYQKEIVECTSPQTSLFDSIKQIVHIKTNT